MDNESMQALSDSPIGFLETITGVDRRFDTPYTAQAFVPAALPETITPTPETQVLLDDATMALGGLSKHLEFVPTPELLIRPVLAGEARATSAMEGTYATLDQILQAQGDNDLNLDVREVLNYVDAAMDAITLIETLPISHRLVCQLHGTLMRQTRGDGADSGQLRSKQVFVGAENRPVSEARFVPVPPGTRLRDGFSDWERWVNADHQMPLLAKVALTHYQFETLHPFSDGNGRLGRLIITLQLMAAGKLSHPVLNLSAWFEPRKAEYIHALFETSRTGDFNLWIQVFCRAVIARAEAASQTIDALFKYRDRLAQELIEQGLARNSATSLADAVITGPVFSASELASRLRMSHQTAGRRIAALEALGAVIELTRGDYARVYYVREVSRVIDAAESGE